MTHEDTNKKRTVKSTVGHKMLLMDQTIHYVKLFTTQADKITRKSKRNAVSEKIGGSCVSLLLSHWLSFCLLNSDWSV